MSHLKDINEYELVERYRNGDKQVFDILFNHYAKSILNTSMRILGSKADAEDIVQETFIDALLKPDYYSYNGSFGGWLTRIAVNKSLGIIRKRKLKWVDLDLAKLNDYKDAEDDTEEPFSRELSFERVIAAIERLPENYRIIFNLYALDGIAHKEIAEMLNISHNNVRIIYHRAKQKIREILQNADK